MDPSEKIFVQHIKQEERYEGKTVDYGGDDGVAECDDDQQGHRREECPPVRHTGTVLDIVHLARGRAEQSDVDIVLSQSHALKQAGGTSRKTLKRDEAVSWNKYCMYTMKLGNTYVRKKVEDDVRS